MRGAFVSPGTYQVRLRVGADEQRQSVTVVGDPLVQLSEADRRSLHGTLASLAELQRSSAAASSVIDRLGADLQEIGKALPSSAPGSEALASEQQKLAAELADIVRVFRGESARGIALTPGRPALAELVAQLYSQVEASTGRPTRQQLELTAESQALMKQQTERLDRLSRAVAALKVKIGKGGLR
jgi:hypothetical protein